MKFSDVYNKYSEEEYLNFDAVENKLSLRSDLHAFIVLDNLCPDTMDMLVSAEHDEVWLSVEPDELDNLTVEQMIELIRCGVRYDFETDSLAMFV